MSNIDDLLKELEETKNLLNRSEERLQYITRHIPTLVAQYSANLETVEYMNDYLIEWFRLYQNKIARSGMKFDQVHDSSETEGIKFLISKSKENNNQPYVYESNFPDIIRNGKRGVYFSGVMIPLFNNHDSINKDSLPTAYLSFARDITKEKQMEMEKEQLKLQAETDSARQKSEFLVHVSHELRTPLTEILGLMETIFSEVAMTDEQQTMAKDAINSGAMLKFLINDLLDLSKMEAGKVEIEHVEFDMKKFLEESLPAISTMSWKKGIPIITYASSSSFSSTYYGDMHRLRQMLVNLLLNSLKYSSRGCIGVSVELADFVPNENQKENCALVISVKDQGVGISDEGRERIFKPFSQAEQGSTRKYGGTGLGLTICEKLAELMHGFVDFASVFGEGSEFWFYLPFQRKLKFEETQKSPNYNAIRVRCEYHDRVLRELIERWSCELNDRLGGGRENLCVNLTPLEEEEADNPMQVCFSFNDDEKVAMESPFFTWKLADLIFARSCQPIHKRSKRNGASKHNKSQTSSPELGNLRKENVPAKKLKGHALCVEDNSISQLILKKYLNSFGLSVTVVNNGLEALNYYKQNHQNIDIILMDCLMPVMDGYESVTLIREFERETKLSRITPIIASTANTMQEDANRCFKVGMNDYLTKPFQKSKMFEVIEKYLTL